MVMCVIIWAEDIVSNSKVVVLEALIGSMSDDPTTPTALTREEA
jgi:hypothetical protein